MASLKTYIITPTPPVVSQASRVLLICDVQKSKYVIGLVDQAVKLLYTIYGIPQDILNAFTMSSCATVVGVPSHKQFLPLTPYQQTGNKQIGVPSHEPLPKAMQQSWRAKLLLPS